MPKLKFFPAKVLYNLTSVQSTAGHNFEKILNVDPEKNNKVYAELLYLEQPATFSQLSYGFDFSKLPKNCTINSVTLKCKAKRSVGNRFVIAEAVSYLTAGNNSSDKNKYGTSFGDQGNIAITEQLQLLTKQYAGVTYADLTKMWVMFFGVRGFFEVTAEKTCQIYGFAIEVDYTEEKPKLGYWKINNQWVLVQKFYKKINGEWILQTILSDIFDKNIHYITEGKQIT